MKHCKKMQMKKVFLTKHLKIDESHFCNRNIIEVVHTNTVEENEEMKKDENIRIVVIVESQSGVSLL